MMSTRRRQMLTAEELEVFEPSDPERLHTIERAAAMEETAKDTTDAEALPPPEVFSAPPGDPAPPAHDPVSPVSPTTIDFVHDVPVDVQVVLGHRRVTIRELLELEPGTVVGLDKAPGDPVDVFINGRLVARGEIVVQGPAYAVKITDVISPDATPRA